MPAWTGCFLGNDRYKPLNDRIDEMAKEKGVSNTAIATAWITRHPANIQVVSGTTSSKRLAEMIDGSNIELTRQEWYELYLLAGNILP